VFDHYPQYHIKILIKNFNAKLGTEVIFRPTIGNESLHDDNNRVRIVNLPHKKSSC
jgi:hypothetical protein